MPFNGEKQCVGEDQPSDSDSSRFSESMASLSDYECSRQSFTSDSSSKSSSPACKLTGEQSWGALCMVLDMCFGFENSEMTEIRVRTSPPL